MTRPNGEARAEASGPAPGAEGGGAPRGGIALPSDLERRLYAFRALVWRVKLIEAACGAACGVLVGYLVVFGLDRVTETPWWVRCLAFTAAVAACAAVPLALHRWVWSHRALDQVARLIARRFPSMGDQLLGIIEIVRTAGLSGAGGSGGLGSRRLCEAAIAQVAEQSTTYDFAAAVPRPRHRRWLALVALPAVAAATAAALVPDAAANAWARFLAPWRAVERFTFARVGSLPDEIVVPRGEPAPLEVTLAADTRVRPAAARVRLGRQPPLATPLEADRYAFTLPPQLAETPLVVAVGDARARARVVPLLRPEITDVLAEVRLPEYLERPEPQRVDVRSGVLAPVKGSSVAIVATANRALASARVDGSAVVPQGATVRTAPAVATEEHKVTIEWCDDRGLQGQRPLVVHLTPRADEAPTLALSGLPAGRDILLSSDTLRFTIGVADDFGIRRVGIEWEGDGGERGQAPEKGERPLKAGGPDQAALEVAATFCPDALGVRPQPLVLRAFAEDYLPGRGRVHSTPFLVYVVDKAEHALVMNERLGRWRQQAAEVRDREMALLAGNTELRKLPAEKLLDPEMRLRLEQQAAAEDAQARRMERLVEEGGKLVREAIKNPEFEAATLERLAEDIQTLDDIGAARMPSVAELLRAAADATLATAGQPGQPSATTQGQPAGDPRAGGSQQPGRPGEPQPGGQPKPDDLADQRPADEQEPDGPSRVGEDHGRAGGAANEQPQPQDETPPIPQVVDRESSQQPDAGERQSPPQSGGGQGRLGLPSTQAGVAPPRPDRAAPAEEEQPAEEALAAAVEAQQRLLEEFAKVADDLARVMANLEGSTFVKRLKLASREQGAIAGRIAGLAADAFGRSERRPAAVQQSVREVAEANAREADKVSHIMDDLQAYLDRRQLPAFHTVLEEMKELDALGSLRQLSDDVTREAGMSLAQSEYWSDTFDRLADDLVEPPQQSQGQGQGETPESVPPEVVLETMQILEEEVNLRDETRVAEQARGAVDAAAHAAAARALADRQGALADRIVGLVDRLLEEEEGERQFAREIELFEKVEVVMAEAADVLEKPDTGPKAIGAETEAIELLLAAQACSGGGGGGGGGGAAGPSGGGGATGTTSRSALALVGAGNRVRGAGDGGERDQATGTSGRVLPEEFRAGLDAYFNRFEKERR
jgi:hypothetical protein